MESLKIFTQECTNDDLGLALSFLWQGQICLLGFYMGRVMDFAEDFGAKVNKHSSTGEHKNIFLH